MSANRATRLTEDAATRRRRRDVGPRPVCTDHCAPEAPRGCPARGLNGRGARYERMSQSAVERSLEPKKPSRAVLARTNTDPVAARPLTRWAPARARAVDAFERPLARVPGAAGRIDRPALDRRFALARLARQTGVACVVRAAGLSRRSARGRRAALPGLAGEPGVADGYWRNRRPRRRRTVARRPRTDT